MPGAHSPQPPDMTIRNVSRNCQIASLGQNYWLENHCCRGEATELPQWGRSLSGLSKVTTAKAPRIVMCDGKERGPRDPEQTRLSRKQKSRYFWKAVAREDTSSEGACLGREKNQKSVKSALLELAREDLVFIQIWLRHDFQGLWDCLFNEPRSHLCFLKAESSLFSQDVAGQREGKPLPLHA